MLLQEAKFEYRSNILSTQNSSLYWFCKRWFDVLVAATALIVLAPVMAMIALVIKLDSPGPAVFVQKRVGARRRLGPDGTWGWEICTFPFYKFRSMAQNADQSLHQAHVKAFVEGRLDASGSDGAKFKLKNDPRVTRVGRILRKLSLDELPQLWNVLRGEMSLVGPRPVPTYEVATYQAWHHERLMALPGLTGLWQVKGRSQVTFNEMIRLDIEYVRHPSLWNDIKIILLTIPAIVWGRGAR